MLRNKLYLYGDEKVKVPAHLHFGKEMFDRMIQYKDGIALVSTIFYHKRDTNFLAIYGFTVRVTERETPSSSGDFCHECRFKGPLPTRVNTHLYCVSFPYLTNLVGAYGCPAWRIQIHELYVTSRNN